MRVCGLAGFIRIGWFDWILDNGEYDELGIRISDGKGPVGIFLVRSRF